MAYNTISEIILDEIRQDILSGRMVPGAKIDQKQLKDRFGVSVIPLREAFKRLQSEGYIDIIPHRGAYIKPLSRGEIDDLYLVRAEVEALAGRLALENLNDEDIKKLEKLFQKMSRLTEAGAFEETLALNRSFHYTIYKACRRTHLLDILEDLWTRSSRYRYVATLDPSRAKAALAEHRAILDACISRDKEALSAGIRQNVCETRKMVEQCFE